MRRCRLLPCLALFLWQIPSASALSGDDLLSLPLEELVSIPVQIATGTPTTSQQAPAATSVITAADLAAMGAQSLDEALETVPGLQVSRSGIIMAPRYFIRGIASTNNPQTLVLVNGLPMTSVWQGDRNPAWQGVPVAAIERVEIIRGPGSAVYGADAFAGVINIITKGPGDIGGGTATLSHGSFDTTQASLTEDGQFGPVRSAFMLSWQHTRGERRPVNADAQTALDPLFGTHASLAPGPVNREARSLDARLDLIWDDWRLRAAWQQAWDIGTGAGVADALDPVGRFGGRFGDVDLLWDDPGLWPHWDISSRLSYGYKSFNPESNVLFFPPGAFRGTFPQGVIDDPSLAEENLRFEQAAVYEGFHGQRLRAGLGYYWGHLSATDEQQNYSLSATQPVPTPLPGGVTDVRGTALLFQPSGERNDRYAFAQDEWAFAPAWQLIAGLRHDHYSGFGGTTNPRLALIWNTTPELTTKLLYGEAFRAPTLAELHVFSNPVNLGNPHLKPEKLRSSELAFAYRPGGAWTLDLNLYEFHVRDFITYVPDASGSTFTAANVGRVHGRGLETEARYQAAGTWQLVANFSVQSTVDDASRRPLGLAPRSKGSLRAVWAVQPHWQLTTQVNVVGDRPRQAGDPRDTLPGYTTVDLTLRRLHLPRGFELSVSGKNLFNANAREPSPGPGPGQMTPSLPDDLPEAGRSLVLALSAHW